MERDFTVKPLGETGLIVKFGDEISPQIHDKIQSLANYLKLHPFAGMIEYVISYTSVAVYYNPFIVRQKAKEALEFKDKSALQIVIHIMEDYREKARQMRKTKAPVVKIPVCYGGEYGPDIEFVAQHNHLSVQEVIDIHTSANYLVYMMAFVRAVRTWAVWISVLLHHVVRDRVYLFRHAVSELPESRRAVILSVRRAVGRLSDAHR